MAAVKMFHVLFVFIWVGNLLALSRFMGYHVKEDDHTQERLASLYWRMYHFIGLPSMILAIVLGLVLLKDVDWGYRPGWIHMKLTLVFFMILLDTVCARLVYRLKEGPDHSKGIRYKLFHGATGLVLIGILCALYVVRDKEGEILHRKENAIRLGKNAIESYDISLPHTTNQGF